MELSSLDSRQLCTAGRRLSSGGSWRSRCTHGVIGKPCRIGAPEESLAHIMRHCGVWAATGSETLDAWAANQA